jgi:DNA-binding FadR family transcriptional regulator
VAQEWTQWVKAADRRRGSDRVAEQIQNAVSAGTLAVGDRLPNERELGRLFGVSRATIREAVRQLETEGMVEVRRGVTGGTFVSQPNPGRLGLGHRLVRGDGHEGIQPRLARLDARQAGAHQLAARNLAGTQISDPLRQGRALGHHSMTLGTR